MISTILQNEAGGFSFSLSPENGVPIYRQIIQQIEYGILSKRLVPGSKLPTIRSLAVELKTNPNTIARAYGELEIRGVVITQVGSGTYISDRKPEPGADEKRAQKAAELTNRYLSEMNALGMDLPEIIALLETKNGGTNDTDKKNGRRG